MRVPEHTELKLLSLQQTSSSRVFISPDGQDGFLWGLKRLTYYRHVMCHHDL